jgi:hypothetical protein
MNKSSGRCDFAWAPIHSKVVAMNLVKEVKLLGKMVTHLNLAALACASAFGCTRLCISIPAYAPAGLRVGVGWGQRNVDKAW